MTVSNVGAAGLVVAVGGGAGAAERRQIAKTATVAVRVRRRGGEAASGVERRPGPVRRWNMVGPLYRNLIWLVEKEPLSEGRVGRGWGYCERHDWYEVCGPRARGKARSKVPANCSTEAA